MQLVCPPELCSIYMLKAPAVGGETLYASAVHAYELLSSDQKAFFETLQCEYRWVDKSIWALSLMHQPCALALGSWSHP